MVGPAFRVPVERAGLISVRHVFWAICVAFFLLPPMALLAAALIEKFVIEDGFHLMGLGRSAFEVLAIYGGSLLFAWIALPLAIPLIVVAIRRGLTGWASAAIAGLFSGTICAFPLSVLLGLEPFVFAASAACGLWYSLVFWLVLRSRCPDGLTTDV